MTFRRRLENSRVLEIVLSGMLAAHLKFCLVTTRWQTRGTDELAEALSQGPVLLVLWHSRTMVAPIHWPHGIAKFTTLHDTSPVARLAGATQRWFGVTPIPMAHKATNTAGSRQILRNFKAGNSVGMAADGPRGPARKLKDAPLEWARVTGAPVFFYAFSMRRHKRLRSWDRMMFPLPFTRGAYIYRRWQAEVPRRMDKPARARLRQEMAEALNTVQADTDAMIDLPPQP
jgi:lysophospholipid acyltransferase (LPLAT)-like uncharacterized protein